MDAGRLLGLGCMRLTRTDAVTPAAATAVIHAALDAGATLLDTADVYCVDEHDVGANERLIAGALAAWAGDADAVLVATKGGLRRPEGRWVADGRARHLKAACADSVEALGRSPLDLYLLHAPDPRTPLATSVRALAALREAGLVRRIGLSNINAAQLDEARRITTIDAVQVRLGPHHLEPVRNGVLDACRRHELLLMAHTPLGGPRGAAGLERDTTLTAMAAHHGVTAAQLALAWLCSLGPRVVPLPGASRTETAIGAIRAQRLELDEADRRRLDELFAAGVALRGPRVRPTRAAGAAADRDDQVVIIMGYPAAGKSTMVERFVKEGYERLNRDERGGRLRDLLPALDEHLREGRRRVVLDNTYPTRSTRQEVIEVADRHGLPVRCLWLQTSIEDAQINACRRMLRRYGELLEPEQMRTLSRRDPGVLPPNALFEYRRRLEPPVEDEGFAEVRPIPFARHDDEAFEARALIVEYEGVLRRSRTGAPVPASPDDVEVVPGRGPILQRYNEAGWTLLGVSWLPGLTDRTLGADLVLPTFARTHELLGVAIDPVWCGHPAGPPACWCRRPLPGLGVLLIDRHRLDPSRCRFVGRSTADRTFASRLGFEFHDAGTFFEEGGTPAP
ncbi:MAG: aldo/keto reductase [Planctomycetota bacterium]|jgi:aryl-alcohol dehydrogenase-like predicted oxidoreductase/predicted kinase/histidinol phosphatase-like enzyme